MIRAPIVVTAVVMDLVGPPLVAMRIVKILRNTVSGLLKIKVSGPLQIKLLATIKRKVEVAGLVNNLKDKK